MFVYLSKKVAIPNNVPLESVTWNRQNGYIACGGVDGLLRVLKLDPIPNSDRRICGLAAPTTLTMNQTLDGHSGSVSVAVWNEHYQKLTTSDSNGLIIVWMLVKGTWIEEMINDRHKSFVRSMSWDSLGDKICIGYEDGAVIVGSVDGNRIWGQDLKDIVLCHVEWSADSSKILFGTNKSDVLIYDEKGIYKDKISILCLEGASDQVKIAAIRWFSVLDQISEYPCTNPMDTPSLAICFDNGRCQFMRSETDEDPILLNTGMTIKDACWNNDGSIIAIVGSQRAEDKEVNVVQFYAPNGEYLRSLKVPGKKTSSCCWDDCGLRIAVAVDSFIYFANIRPNYKWGYCASTVVYTYTKPERTEDVVVFWNSRNNEKYVKYIQNLEAIASHGENCCLATKSEQNYGQNLYDDYRVHRIFMNSNKPQRTKYCLSLCNAIGAPLDCRYIDMCPKYTCMSDSHIFAANGNAFFSWQFKNIKQLASLDLSTQRKSGMEHLFHVEDIPAGAGEAKLNYSKAQLTTEDPICALCCSEKILLVARESGILNHYSLPNISLQNKYQVASRPRTILLNSDSSIISITDQNGMLNLFDIENQKLMSSIDPQTQQEVRFERKDVWNVLWAKDNAEQFAVMEKTRLYIFRGQLNEDPISSSGYLCSFDNLHVKSVLLDEILKIPERPNRDYVIELEVKSLRDTRDLLEKVGIIETQKFIEKNQHPRLWRLLAEKSLEQLNLQVAELAFVRCKDYPGIQFIRRISQIQNEEMKKAEVAAYFKQFEIAENLYLKQDRVDLAVALRKKLGDWFRVVELLKGNNYGSDLDVQEAFNAIGDYYADRQQWKQAVNFYVQGRNQDQLAQCYYMLEDYQSLAKMMDSLPENHKLLPQMAEMFVGVGMVTEAVKAYLKCNRIRPAINCCIQLNQWNTAIELATKHNVSEINSQLTQYADRLLAQGQKLYTIELYRKANRYFDAARLLFEVAEVERESGASPLHMKRLYVLAALLVEEYQKQTKNSSKAEMSDSSKEASNALAGLLQQDAVSVEDNKLMDNAWRGAEAYHYLLLTQRQLYNGNVDAAVKTSFLLQEYQDILPTSQIFSMLALSSVLCCHFGLCSKAFTKLETLECLTAEQKLPFEELAMEIFTKHSPKDNHANVFQCNNCGATLPDWSNQCENCETRFPVCIATGGPLLDYQYWACSQCRHRAQANQILQFRNCPLCHCEIK